MVILKLAYKNIIGAGLRTWLNAIVLSFSYIAIIWTQGFYQGMNEQLSREMIDWEVGGGQFRQENYDPYDPFMLEDSHERIPDFLKEKISRSEAAPILIRPATIYPDGRLQAVLLKGIEPRQSLLKIPSASLDTDEYELPALIGQRMAEKARLKTGDYLTMRWRDANGTFDAADICIVHIMSTVVSSIDNGQIWLPLEKMRTLMQMPDEATIIIFKQGLETGLTSSFSGNETVLFSEPQDEDAKASNAMLIGNWRWQSQDDQLQPVRELVKNKSVGGSILYAVLLFLAMIAIFDTQVLSIWRRRKEMGTMMAMGMTRRRVIGLFTLEGAFHGVVAAVVAAIYGIPLLIYFGVYGYTLPAITQDYGYAFSEKLFPVYSAGLVLGTTLLVLVVVTIVSFLPTRRIAKLKPTDALRGRSS